MSEADEGRVAQSRRRNWNDGWAGRCRTWNASGIAHTGIVSCVPQISNLGKTCGRRLAEQRPKLGRGQSPWSTGGRTDYAAPCMEILNAQANQKPGLIGAGPLFLGCQNS